jgi:hypothetical protein
VRVLVCTYIPIIEDFKRAGVKIAMIRRLRVSNFEYQLVFVECPGDEVYKVRGDEWIGYLPLDTD